MGLGGPPCHTGVARFTAGLPTQAGLRARARRSFAAFALLLSLVASGGRLREDSPTCEKFKGAGAPHPTWAAAAAGQLMDRYFRQKLLWGHHQKMCLPASGCGARFYFDAFLLFKRMLRGKGAGGVRGRQVSGDRGGAPRRCLF